MGAKSREFGVRCVAEAGQKILSAARTSSWAGVAGSGGEGLRERLIPVIRAGRKGGSGGEGRMKDEG